MSKEVKRIDVGVVTAFAEAKRAATPYPYDREKFRQDLANLGTTAAEVEANRHEVAENTQAVADDKTAVAADKASAAQSAAAAAQSAANAHTDALAATAAKEAAEAAQGIAEEARTDAVSAKGAAESAQTEANASASAATEAALAAGNAAQTATTQAGAASDSAAAAAQSAASVSGVVAEVTAAKTEAITAIEAKGAETLDSIPEDYTELSGDVTDLKSALKNNIDAIGITTAYINWSENHRYIKTDGTYADVSNPVTTQSNVKYIVISCNEGDVYQFSATGGSASRAYATIDETGLIKRRAAGSTALANFKITIRADETGLIINDTTLNGYIVKIDKDLDAEIGAINNHISAIENRLFEFGSWDIDLSSCRLFPATISKNNVWNSGVGYESYLVDVSSYISSGITIYASAARDCILGFLTNDIVGMDQTDVDTFAAGETGRRTITAGASQTFTIPDNCNYVLIFKTSSGNDFTPSAVSINGSRVQASENWSSKNAVKFSAPMLELNPLRAINSAQNGRDIPQSIAIRNAYKKAHQLLDLQWVALHPYPKTETPNTYAPAGNVIAVPYSSVKEYNKFVGYNVSIRTFMTAVHNPYSLMYTENTLETHKQSAYGIDYHGVNCGPYFGDVCSSFDLLCLGMSIPWTTNQFPYLEKIGKLVKITDQSANGVRLMDIVHEPGHTTIITDIIRDERGTPTQITVSEYGPKTTNYTPELFNERLRTKSGTIYMYMDLYKNLEYEPSEFVAVDGEPTPQTYTYNDDICTFAGDYACFNSGEDIYINYTAGNYTQMEIYKGNALIDTITLDTSGHSVKIETSGYGKYKARLTNGSTHSDFTYFEIVDTTLTANYSDGVLTINFSSENGVPSYAEIVTRAGVTRGFIELNASEITTGIITVDPAKLVTEQLPGVTLGSTIYPRVLFRGEYGMVANPFYAVQV